jgi:signal transduction histidine kinase
VCAGCSHVITVQEEERQRIARDLHDHLGQQMTALHLRLAALAHPSDDRPAWEARFKETQTYLMQLDRDLDFFTWELRPAAIYDLGLSVALRDYIEQWSQHVHIAAEFHDMRATKDRFSPEIETNLYRIAQEALNNVHKPSEAATVDVRLRLRGSDIVLTIEDDGIGFDPEKTHASTAIGVIGMRERAALLGGRLEIETTPGRGTVVLVIAPAAYRQAQP